MRRNNRAMLTEGPIKSTLVKLTIPMVFGIIGFVIFNLVDTFYVCRGGMGTLPSRTDADVCPAAA